MLSLGTCCAHQHRRTRARRVRKERRVVRRPRPRRSRHQCRGRRARTHRRDRRGHRRRRGCHLITVSSTNTAALPCSLLLRA